MNPYRQPFVTVYEVKFLQGPNKRPYLYQAFTPGISTGDTVVVDVNPDGYKLARVVKVESLHPHTAGNYASKIVCKVDDAFYLQQKKIVSELDQVARSVRKHAADVEAAEAAVVDLAKRRTALAESKALYAKLKSELDNGDFRTARYWAVRADIARMDRAYDRKMGALHGLPDDGWDNC